MEGNARDKVKEAYGVLLQWEADDAAGVAGTTDKPEAKSASEALFAVRMLLQDALRMPLRNCEVGTVEEHAQRFYNFCESNSSGINGMCKPTCPCIDCFDKCQCFAKWSLMPYEDEEGGAK